MAEVKLTRQAMDDLEQLPLVIHGRVIKVLERLAQWPAVSGAKPLRHGLAGCFRVRTGDYRIQFRVDGQTVLVERIGHRDGFYEG
ncbi:MAG: type II toxin-antitoxin system RelE/ParE family toxin [Phycisphaeraceae bacterium]|nr:type II toxin-antitoxin system RelE/ParE family toxin [Phycisphaeraceae bacterium]